MYAGIDGFPGVPIDPIVPRSTEISHRLAAAAWLQAWGGGANENQRADAGATAEG